MKEGRGAPSGGPEGKPWAECSPGALAGAPRVHAEPPHPQTQALCNLQGGFRAVTHVKC